MDQALKNCDLFAHMTADEARLCLGCSGAVEEKYGRGGMVFCETDTPTRLFVLLEGSVTVGRDSADGRRAVMARIGSPGDLFWLFEPDPLLWDLHRFDSGLNHRFSD